MLAVATIGLVAVGIWLWHRKSPRTRADVAVQPPAAAAERKTALDEPSTSVGGSAEDGEKESAEYAQGDPHRAGKSLGQCGSEAKSTNKETDQMSSSVVAEDEQGIASEASPEGGSQNVRQERQTVEDTTDRETEHAKSDARLGSDACLDNVGEKHDAQSQSDEKSDGTDDEDALDERKAGVRESGLEVATKDTEDAEEYPATSADVSEDGAVESNDGEYSQGVGRTDVVARASHVRRCPEGGAETASWADHDRNDPGGSVISSDELTAEDARVPQAAASERTEEACADRAAKGQLSRDGEISAEGEEQQQARRGRTDLPSCATVPPPEGASGAEARTEAGGKEESESQGDSRAQGDHVRREAQRTQRTPVHRDRRGLRRHSTGTPIVRPPSTSATAEARLRLLLDPVQRTAMLSVVLARPEGFPERIEPLVDLEGTVEAFDGSRYDDLALPWTGDLLDGELRIQSKEGKQWLRSARGIHIFEESPAESGMISVGGARPDVLHAIVCKADDEQAVRAAARSTGSPPLASHSNWNGIPEGWLVLSGYRPRHTSASPMPTQLRPLDPGIVVEISLSGGLAIRATVYAEGRPPRIGISPLPDGASVTIGGVAAEQASDGAWEASGWDRPGYHLVDVVPGPSRTYQIMPDPTKSDESRFWNAYPDRFCTGSREPWARAEICGAVVRGPEGEAVIASLTHPVLIALGERRQAVSLMPRGDVPASVAVMSERPAFLIAATGQRRKQGRIVWLGSSAMRGTRSNPDQHWAETVRSVVARRLPFDSRDPEGERAWRNAKQRARRIWRRR